MASTADTILIGVEFMDAGDKVNTWGTDTQTDNMKVLAKASHGYVSVALTGDRTVSESNYSTTNETENAVIVFTGSLSTAANYVVPARHRRILVFNNAGDTVTVKTSGGAGVAIPTGYSCWVYCDGTDVYSRPHFFNSTVRATAAVQSNELTTLNQVSALIAAQLTAGDGSALVSADDTTRKFLEDVFTSATDNAEFSTTNGGGNEGVQLTVQPLAMIYGGQKSTAFTAAVNTAYTALTGMTILFPSAPSTDAKMSLALSGSTPVFTLNPNGLKINGDTNNLVLDQEQTLLLTYTGADRGWV